MSVQLPPFQRLIDAHWRDVVRLAVALAGPQDGPDVAQQAWLQAYAAYPRLTSTRNLRGWLMTITHRCSTDAHRANSRRPAPVAELPEEHHPHSAPPEADEQTGHGSLERWLRPGPSDAGPFAGDPQLWAAVQQLPERSRQALVLRYVGDLDHAHIAGILDTSATMSRRLVSDALAAIRKELRDD